MVNGYVPNNLQEALDVRGQYDVVPYGGGTDLMVDEEQKGTYLFLHKVPELKRVSEDSESYYFGACCTFTQLLENSITPAILKEALSKIAAPAIRNAGTIGGNIGNGSAKADSALIFFVTDSMLRLVSKDGERLMPVKDFYLGRKKLALEKNELIAEVIMPKKWLSDYYYEKVGARKALAISRLSFAGLLSVQEGKIAHCAAAFGAVSDVIIRREDIDSLMIGKTVREAIDFKEEYIARYDEAIVPIRGRVSAEYRKTVCLNLLRNFIDAKVI